MCNIFTRTQLCMWKTLKEIVKEVKDSTMYVWIWNTFKIYIYIYHCALRVLSQICTHVYKFLTLLL